MRSPACLKGHGWPRSPSKAAQKVWGSAAGGQNTANHTHRVNLKGKHDLALCSGRSRQRVWCDEPASDPKHTQLLSESGESEQPTAGTHPATIEQQLDHMLFF